MVAFHFNSRNSNSETETFLEAALPLLIKCHPCVIWIFPSIQQNLFAIWDSHYHPLHTYLSLTEAKAPQSDVEPSMDMQADVPAISLSNTPRRRLRVVSFECSMRVLCQVR